MSLFKCELDAKLPLFVTSVDMEARVSARWVGYTGMLL